MPKRLATALNFKGFTATTRVMWLRQGSAIAWNTSIRIGYLFMQLFGCKHMHNPPGEFNFFLEFCKFNLPFVSRQAKSCGQNQQYE